MSVPVGKIREVIAELRLHKRSCNMWQRETVDYAMSLLKKVVNEHEASDNDRTNGDGTDN